MIDARIIKGAENTGSNLFAQAIASSVEAGSYNEASESHFNLVRMIVGNDDPAKLFQVFLCIHSTIEHKFFIRQL